MAGETSGRAMVRVNRTDLDLAFRPAHERALTGAAAFARQVGRVATKTGSVLMAGGFLLTFAAPHAGPLVFAMGILVAVGGLAAHLVGVVTNAPATWLHRLHLGRLRRGMVGQVLRLRGRVRPQRILDGPGSEPAVLARLRAMRGSRGVEMQTGHDFLLEDGAGEPALVLVEHALLLDDPGPVVGFRPAFPMSMLEVLPAGEESVEYEEALIRPDDMVEVLGIYDERVDPTVVRLERGAPIRRILRGSTTIPVLVRRLP